MNGPTRGCRLLRNAWLLAATFQLGLAFGCGASPQLAHAPEEDVLLSYFQAAHGLASGLTRIRTSADFEAIKKDVDKVADDLIAYRKELEDMPVDDRRRLSRQHADLVAQTTSACKLLEERHMKDPKIIGDRWDRYWEALQFRDIIEP